MNSVGLDGTGIREISVDSFICREINIETLMCVSGLVYICMFLSCVH